MEIFWRWYWACLILFPVFTEWIHSPFPEGIKDFLRIIWILQLIGGAIYLLFFVDPGGGGTDHDTY